MEDLAHTVIRKGVATLVITYPPVNALAQPVRQAIVQTVHGLIADTEVRAIVLAGGGRTFFPGADVSEFDGPLAAPDLSEVVALLEGSPKPVIAAIHGAALGGGLEVALGAHFRVAAPAARLGFPEVSLGLIPGAGGTQRLPRLVDAVDALELIAGGRSITAEAALKLGLIDRIADADLLTSAEAYALELLDSGADLPRLSFEPIRIGDRAALEARLVTLAASASLPLRATAAAFRAGQVLTYDEALRNERRLFEELMEGVGSRALRYLFFAERAAGQVRESDRRIEPRQVQTVGIIGAGTMGGGIAMNFLNIGVPATIIETNQAALDRGVATIRRNYEASARKGRLTLSQVDERMALLRPALGLEALAHVDLVIEAVFESMPVKQDIFAKLDQIAKPGAILASNTSFLDLDEIARATKRPESVVGLHFFSPANIMRLLEIVRGRETAPDVLATSLSTAKRIGKLAVVAGVCHGFIANRAMDARRREAERALLAGASAQQVDELLVGYGFPMGQFAMMDLVGLDVMGRDSSERTVMGELVAHERLGQKSGGGYYDYDDKRRAIPSDDADAIIRTFAMEAGVPQLAVPEDLLIRILAPVVNEGARILEEGIAQRASDIDVALVAGYGWPAETGGPMFWADTVGLSAIVATLNSLAVESGNKRHEPARLLREHASAGRAIHQFSR